MQRDIKNILLKDKARLESALHLDSSTSRIEVQSLLQYVLNVQRSYLLAHPEQALSEVEQDRYDRLLQRRLHGEPIAHLLGSREFFGLDFKVTSDTLIPRPETELLVEQVLQRIGPPSHDGRSGPRVLDLGTGTGAIALSIGYTRTDVAVVAADASDAALQVARENAERLGVCNVSFVHSDWFTALSGQCFDLIAANPPYIIEDDEHLSQGDVRFEPLAALASGPDGLADIRRIIADAPRHLYSKGWLLLEHGYDQAESVRALLEKNGFDKVFSEKDLAGIERISGGQLPV